MAGRLDPKQTWSQSSERMRDASREGARKYMCLALKCEVCLSRWWAETTLAVGKHQELEKIGRGSWQQTSKWPTMVLSADKGLSYMCSEAFSSYILLFRCRGNDTELGPCCRVCRKPVRISWCSATQRQAQHLQMFWESGPSVVLGLEALIYGMASSGAWDCTENRILWKVWEHRLKMKASIRAPWDMAEFGL